MSSPYTYLIKCVPEGRFYYGVRWAKGCNPNDLWSTYFTSSKTVQSLVKKHGPNSFEFEVRRVFNTSKEAQAWEHRVLRRLNAKDRKDFINLHNGGALDGRNRKWMNRAGLCRFVDEKYVSEYELEGWVIGRIFSKDHTKKIKESNKGNPSNFKGLKHSEKTKNSLSKIASKRSKNPNSKRFCYNGKTYDTIKSAQEENSLSRWMILKSGNYISETHKLPSSPSAWRPC